jgi:hypothetical protein
MNDVAFILYTHTDCKDEAVFTSRGFIWVYPGKPLPESFDKTVIVLKADHNYSKEELLSCYAICCDDINKFKEILK